MEEGAWKWGLECAKLPESQWNHKKLDLKEGQQTNASILPCLGTSEVFVFSSHFKVKPHHSVHPGEIEIKPAD